MERCGRRPLTELAGEITSASLGFATLIAENNQFLASPDELLCQWNDDILRTRLGLSYANAVRRQ